MWFVCISLWRALKSVCIIFLLYFPLNQSSLHAIAYQKCIFHLFDWLILGMVRASNEQRVSCKHFIHVIFIRPLYVPFNSRIIHHRVYNTTAMLVIISNHSLFFFQHHSMLNNFFLCSIASVDLMCVSLSALTWSTIVHLFVHAFVRFQIQMC